MKAISPRGTIRFVPACDKDLPVEEQSTVVLRPLTVGEEIVVDDSIYKRANNKTIVSTGSKNLMAIHLGLVDIENFSVKIEREKVADDNGVYLLTEATIASIPKSVRDEIALRVLTAQNPDEEDRKN